MQTSPALPGWKQVEAPTHVERPRGENVRGARHDCANNQKREQDPREAARAGFSLHGERAHREVSLSVIALWQSSS